MITLEMLQERRDHNAAERDKVQAQRQAIITEAQNAGQDDLTEEQEHEFRSLSTVIRCYTERIAVLDELIPLV